MQEWVHSFKASGVDTIKTDDNGRLKVNAPTQNNEPENATDVGKLKETVPALATNGEEDAYSGTIVHIH